VKPRTDITIEKNLLDWLDKQVKKKRFASRSHGIEYLISREIEKNDI